MPSRSLFIPSCMTVQRQQQRQGKQPGGGGVGVRLGPGCREAVVVGTSSSLPLPFVPSPQNLSSEVPRRPPDPLPAPPCLKTSTVHDDYILFWPPSRRPQQQGDNTNFCITLCPCARTTSSCCSTSTLAECQQGDGPALGGPHAQRVGRGDGDARAGYGPAHWVGMCQPNAASPGDVRAGNGSGCKSHRKMDERENLVIQTCVRLGWRPPS